VYAIIVEGLQQRAVRRNMSVLLFCMNSPQYWNAWLACMLVPETVAGTFSMRESFDVARSSFFTRFQRKAFLSFLHYSRLRCAQ